MRNRNLKNSCLDCIYRMRSLTRSEKDFAVCHGSDRKKAAFTLAEIIAVIVILGVIAAITIPIALKNTTERQNRTKIKKAMAVYDNALSQYYLNDYYSYKAEINAIPLDPNNVLPGLNGNAYFQALANLRNIRNANRDVVKARYSRVFSDYFNKSVQDANNPGVFRAKDGLWWDITPDEGRFFTVMVAFKPEDLNARTANSSENKAFYLIARMPNYARTPISNPTYSKDFATLALADLKDNTDSEISDILRMQKLYLYVMGETFNRFIDADKVCKNAGCCNNTNGSCLRILPSAVRLNGHVRWGTTTSQDGVPVKFDGYDENNELILSVDYVNRTERIKKDGEEICYRYSNLGSHECSIDFSLMAGDLWNGTTCCMAYCGHQRFPCD